MFQQVHSLTTIKEGSGTDNLHLMLTTPLVNKVLTNCVLKPPCRTAIHSNVNNWCFDGDIKIQQEFNRDASCIARECVFES